MSFEEAHAKTRRRGGFDEQSYENPAVSAPLREFFYFGTIAPFAQRNYYKEAVDKLKVLAKEFRREYGGTKADYQIRCNSQIPEKPIAVACGLGSMGRNDLVIMPKDTNNSGGSNFIIAMMHLPFALPGDPPLDWDPCKRCQAPCQEACPTKALDASRGKINLEKCIQWWASGHNIDKPVPEELKAVWGKRFYGCTNCQDACVHNKAGQAAYIDCKKILAMTDDEINALFKGTAIGMKWLGPAAIRRNAEIVCKNQKALDSGP
ncbi:MAG: hypothetical protein LBM77_12000 [Spirochaetaceae bacterium]|nr:hypothetical protein [Spirochaetaceae bacterium]